MKNLLFSLFAIGVAAVAAMTATTAMLNAPHRAEPVVLSTLSPVESQGTSPASSLAQDSKAVTQSGNDNSGAAKPAESGTPSAGADAKDDEEADKDPYEGVPEEELPPDMQYSADSSVSFPTNI